MRSLAVAAFSSMLAAQGPGGAGTPQPLPAQPIPAQNPLTAEKAVLGKLLFWEEQMSTDNRVACGTCHTFGAGGGDLRRVRGPGPDGVLPSADDVFGSPGVRHSDAANDYWPDARFGFESQVTGRASPGFLVAAWFRDLFWDGRASTTFVDPANGQVAIPVGGALESQALAPLLDGVEMAHDQRTFAQATDKLRTARPMALASNLPADMAAAIAGDTSYPDLFDAAFGTPDITARRIAFALASYQRTLVPDQTPYDAFVAGNPAALTPQQAMGLNVFLGPGRCAQCHTTGLFSDGQFHNLGLRPITEDNGRQAVTGLPADAGRFKTPSLRNVGLRSTFMHNGQFTTLQQVVGFYRNGGGPFMQNKDPLLVPLQIQPQAVTALLDFLTNGLTDPRVAASVTPFDRPTLRAELLPPAGNLSGLPTAGSGSIAPVILGHVPANVGNVDFKIGIHDALGGAAATFVLSPQPGNQLLSGVRVNVALGAGELLVPYTLAGSAGLAGVGYGTLRFPVPDLPALAGLSMWGQWFVWDAGAPSGVATTRAARFDLF